MKETDALPWLRQLLDKSVERDSHGQCDEEEATAWIAEAQSALAAILPSGHVLLRQWESVPKQAKEKWIALQSTRTTPLTLALEPYRGVVQAAVNILAAGRLGSLMEGVRAETVIEVLDQTDALLPKYVVAAAVLAGGALETHLLHLCTRAGIVPAGEGSISKYDGAIAQARNAGTVEVYAATDTKLVTAWGGIRNDAAHEPTKFSRSADEVRLMIDGIRQFVARVP